MVRASPGTRLVYDQRSYARGDSKMVDLTAEMAQLWATLGPVPVGRPRAIQFVAAHRGAGTSTFAREFARFAVGQSSKPVWLVDLELDGPGQAEAIAAEADRFGPLGKGVAASPDGSSFFAVRPRAKAGDGRPVPDARYLAAHRVADKALWVTRFRRDVLRGAQRGQVTPGRAYWDALRRHASTIVVDSPAADRSRAWLTVAPAMDLSVLVVAADDPDEAAPGALKVAIEEAGGRFAGIVVNRAVAETPRFRRAIPS